MSTTEIIRESFKMPSFRILYQGIWYSTTLAAKAKKALEKGQKDCMSHKMRGLM